MDGKGRQGLGFLFFIAAQKRIDDTRRQIIINIDCMKKVLVVDDDNDILSLVEMILSMNDFGVDAISQWEKIDDRILNFHPDIILLDVSLNGADGRDICRKIKTIASTQHIPVILFSAHAEVADSFKDCLAQGFIAKPFEISHLVKTLRSNLQ